MPTHEVDRRVVPFANPRGFPWTPADPAQPTGARMKGFALVHLLDWMNEKHGEGAVQHWVGSLPERLRPTVDRRSLTSIGWIPIEFYFSAIRFLVDTYSQGDVRAALSLGHAIATLDISTFFRAAMSFASPTTVLSLSGRFWKSYFDQSELVVVDSTSQSCAVELRSWPFNDPVAWHELGGSLIAWMEASRARDVRLTRFELIAPNQVRLEAAWE